MLTTKTELRPFHVNTLNQSNDAATPSSPPQAVAQHCRTTENIMKKVETFFSKPEHMGKLLPFLHGTSKISLRMIEWFVFVYAMQQTVDWFIGEEYFNVYLDYQAEMEDNKKQRFDPMGRKWRKEKRKGKNGELSTVKVYHGINFFYNDDDYVVTSVAQLNFFRWFIGKGILDYMIEHFDELTNNMNQYNVDKKRQKRVGPAKKDEDETLRMSPQTSKNENKKVRVQAMKKVTKKNVEVYVSFD